MFRTKQYCERYEQTPIQLDTALVSVLGNNVKQQKNGYHFTVNDRSSYFDWYNGYFEVSFKINKLADGNNYGGADQIAMINNAASLIDQLVIKQNGKIVYDCNSLYKVINIKNMIEMSEDYAKSTGTNEYIAIDTNTDAESRADEDAYNSGFAVRKSIIQGGSEVNAKIPLNNYSFFKGLEQHVLPPSQLQISLQLTNDDELIFKAAAADEGRVIITRLVLWVPRLIFNDLGLNLIVERYTKARWSYLREMITQSPDSRQSDITFRITSGVTRPQHVFIYLQRSDKSNSQNHNPYLLDTLKVNSANNNCTLSSCRLEVGNGIFYPETEYTGIARIYDDVINYYYKQNNKTTGSLLNRLNFYSLFGFIHFNLEYKREEVTQDPKQITLALKLTAQPANNIRVYAIVLYEETVEINTIGNELVII